MNLKLKKAYKTIDEKWQNTPYEVCNQWCSHCQRDIQIRCEFFKDNMNRELNEMLQNKRTEAVPREPLVHISNDVQKNLALADARPYLCHALACDIHYYCDDYHMLLIGFTEIKASAKVKEKIANAIAYTDTMALFAYKLSDIFMQREKIKGKSINESFVKYYRLLQDDINASENCLRIIAKTFQEHKYKFYKLIRDLKAIMKILNDLEQAW
jgi:hypothetical protein